MCQRKQRRGLPDELDQCGMLGEGVAGRAGRGVRAQGPAPAPAGGRGRRGGGGWSLGGSPRGLLCGGGAGGGGAGGAVRGSCWPWGGGLSLVDSELRRSAPPAGL